VAVFPPSVGAFTSRTRTSAASAADPDTRTPARFLLWLLRDQGRVLAVNAGVGLLWFLPGTVGPYLMGKAIDRGILAHDFGATATWAGLLLLAITVGVFAGIGLHTGAVSGWLVALYKTMLLVARKVAQMGHVLPRRTPTGEILSVASSDSDTFGALTEVVGRAIAAGCAFLVIAAIVLGESPTLGLVTLIAAPLLVGAASPLLRPLQRAQALERTRSSELTGMATDIVAGLRILRGIGGERTFGDNYAAQSQRTREAGVRAGVWQAATDALGALLSGLLLVVLTWLGTREMLAGRLTLGQLVSFFGYAVFMVWPIQTFFELAQKWIQALVAAGKTLAVLGQQPPWAGVSQPVPLPADAEIADLASGFRARPHELTVVVSALPDESAALADRIGRYLPTAEEPVSSEVGDEVSGRAARRVRQERARKRAEQARADEERAGRPWGVTIGGVDLSRVDLAELRSRVLVSDTASLVFAGTLQHLLDPHGLHTREEAEQALRVANAEDVYDALPGGWRGVLDERGRGLSGGQRQRLVLARALLCDPEVLVLVEPTSAVDAHTEARIAERLAEHRRGRTTIVTTVSPLLLHHADTVLLLRDGVAIARGRHHDLLASDPDYRAVVARGLDSEPAAAGPRVDATSRRPDAGDEPVVVDEPVLVAPYGPVPMADRVRDEHWEVSE